MTYTDLEIFEGYAKEDLSLAKEIGQTVISNTILGNITMVYLDEDGGTYQAHDDNYEEITHKLHKTKMVSWLSDKYKL